MPPVTTATVGPMALATTPASSSPSCGPPMKNTMFTPTIRPRSRSGVSSWRIRFLNTMLTVSAAPVAARQRERQPERARQSEGGSRRAIHEDARQQHHAAALDPVDAANHHRAGDDRTDRGRRVQPPVATRADVQDVLSENRQERGRRREKRRKEIEQHRRTDERRAKDEAQSFERARQRETAADITTAGLAGCPGTRLWHPHHEQRGNDHQKRRGVERVDPGDAAGRDDQAAERGPGDRRDLHHDRVQGDGAWQVLARDEVGHERLPRGKVEGAGSGAAGRQHVNRPQPRETVKCQRCQHDGQRRP